MARAGVRIERLVLVVAIGNGHEVVALVIDQAVVTLGKGIIDHLKAVADALVLSVDHEGGHGQADDGVKGVVDDLVDAILDVTLCDEPGAVGVVQFIRPDRGVLDLIEVVAFKDVTAGRGVQQRPIGAQGGNAWIEDLVSFLVVVGERVVVGQHQNELLVELLNGDVRCIGARYNLEAVVKQGLRLVVGDAEQLHRSEGVTGIGTCPDHAHRDVVVVARFERKGSSRLQKEAVACGVARGLLCPRFHLLADRAPLVGIGVAGVHVVRGDGEVGAGTFGNAIATVGHALSVLPVTAHVVVVVHTLAGLAIDAAGPVVIEEFAHAVALVVYDAVTVSDADSGVWNAQRVNGVGKYAGEWIVHAIGVLIRSFKEVDAHGGRVLAVADGVARGLVKSVAVVAVSQPALHVAPHVVVHVPAEVAVHPLREVGVGQCLRALVDEHVVAERHVVDLVVGGESKALRTDFHADGLAKGLGVDVAFVVENPVVRLVAIQRHLVFTPTVATVDLLKEVVPRVVSEGGVVVAIAVVVVEWGEVIVLVQGHIAVCGVLKEVTGNGIAVGEFDIEVAGRIGSAVEVLAVAHGILPFGNRELVVRGAGGLHHLCSALVGQRTGPEVVAVVAVAGGSQFELLVRGDAREPKRSAVHDTDARFLGHHVGALVYGAVVPE